MTQPRRIFRPGVLLTAIVILAAVRPGDTPWINDEPILMELAIRYNHFASDIYGFSLPFTPCPFGALGTRGARYGPLPAWLEQLGLALTHDLAVMVAVRAVAFSGLTALALYWLARVLGLGPWFAVVTLLGPWLWFYSRSLGDVTWSIPICAGVFAAYAAFLDRPTGGPLRVALLCCILLPLVHLMGLALVLPVGIHFLVFHWRAIWKWKWSVLCIVAACLYLFRPYLMFMLFHTQPSRPQGNSPVLGWLFPLLGGHYLTLGVAGTMPGDGWQDYAPEWLRFVVSTAQWISRLALVAVWIGMILAMPRAWRALRVPDAAVKDHLCVIGLATWICQTVLDGLERLYFSPHYYVGTWIAYAFFAWIAMDWLLGAGVRIGAVVRGAVAIYAACLVIGVCIISATIARDGGTRGVYYGTCLGNQMEAVEKIRQFSDRSVVDIQFPNWRLYPMEMKVLVELNPAPDGFRPVGDLIVKHRGGYPGDARITVQSVGAGSGGH